MYHGEIFLFPMFRDFLYLLEIGVKVSKEKNLH